MVGDQRRYGMRTKVCRAFQTKSRPGILSVTNSAQKRTPQATSTQVCPSEFRLGGRSTQWKRASTPRVRIVA